MHFLRELFNSKQRNLNTNDSASKAKGCECSGKKQSIKPIFDKKCPIFGLIFRLYKYF